MKASPVFVVFFVFFTLATVLAPVPMFPGNMVYTWLGTPSPPYAFLASALMNGIIYGLVAWIVYVLASRKIEKSITREFPDEEKKIDG